MSTVSSYMMKTGQVYGRVRLNDKAPIYKNRWVEFVEANERGVVVSIFPTDRDFSHDKVDKIELSEAWKDRVWVHPSVRNRNEKYFA